jgi:biopolymer transport protein ExbB
LVVGPLAFFESEDDSHVGPVVERLGSLEPNVVAFPPSKARGAGAEDGAPVDFGTMTANTIRTGQGRLPLDATLGKAQQMAETRETLMDHISKGGVVMYPILGLGAFAILVALVKWVQLSLVRMPSERRLMDVCNDLLHHRFEEARQGVQRLSGPLKGMLADALEHVDEPRELIEEVMYEHILETRMKLQRGLPFIAVSASSAPLLGLLGTVTGIISTFRLITVFGSGDVKMLSAGISEALVTTEFGLIVAIPALLIHAFLNRRARGLVDRMEKTAVVVLNKLGRSDAAAFSVGYTDEDRASGYGPTAEAASAPAQG